MIKSYQFGQMVVSDTTRDLVLHNDIMIYDSKVEDWQRDSSHLVLVKDVEKAVAQKPEYIIIGNGDSGMMTVSDDVRDHIESQNIQLMIFRTAEAVEEFNRLLGMGRKVVGLFHLTC